MVKSKFVRPLESRPVRHLTPHYVRARLADVRYRRSNPDEPWLTPTAVRFLDQFLHASDQGLEVGSGRSTAWLAARLTHLVSIESNPDWYHRVKTLLEERALSAKVQLVHANDLDSHLEAIRAIQDDSLDFCLIDGKYRGATATAALSKLRLGGVLVVDDVHRYLPSDTTRSPHARRVSDGPDGEDWENFMNCTRTWREFRTSNGVKDTAFWIRVEKTGS